MERPLGITIIGILYIVGGIAATIGAVMFVMFSTMMLRVLLSEFAMLGGVITGIFAVVATLEFVIAGCLLSAQKWARKIVIIFIVTDLVLEFFSVFGGNMFGVVMVVLDLFVLYYLYRPHVIKYFGGDAYKTCMYCGYIAKDDIELHNHHIICKKNDD